MFYRDGYGSHWHQYGEEKIQEIKNGVVTKATVIDYSMNLDNSYKELYEYEVGKFLVRAYSKNSSTNIGKIKGKKVMLYMIKSILKKYRDYLIWHRCQFFF